MLAGRSWHSSSCVDKASGLSQRRGRRSESSRPSAETSDVILMKFWEGWPFLRPSGGLSWPTSTVLRLSSIFEPVLKGLGGPVPAIQARALSMPPRWWRCSSSPSPTVATLILLESRYRGPGPDAGIIFCRARSLIAPDGRSAIALIWFRPDPRSGRGG
jgi:hypothetical protein